MLKYIFIVETIKIPENKFKLTYDMLIEHKEKFVVKTEYS